MKILVVGSGGREHSILLKLNESSMVEKLFCIPGNAGTGQVAVNIDIKQNDLESIVQFVKENNIDLTVIGPEQPLIDGYADRFEKEGLNVFGPSSKAAEIEGSKAFSKELMKKYNIPTAKFKTFSDYDKAKSYLNEQTTPIVIKASGLAAGKGAVVCFNKKEADETLDSMMITKDFGKAGEEVVIEEYLEGEEASVFAVSDGNYYKILASAQDHKAAYDGDKGPNTGGMGSYAPAPIIDDKTLDIIEKTIIKPTFEAMKKEKRQYKGTLFIGLMLTSSGPKVIEYNCRFGDPETQVILPILEGDLAKLLYDASSEGFTSNEILPLKNKHYLCLILASGGYPSSYKKGYEIKGLDQEFENTSIVHAGTSNNNGVIVTSGGRVLGVVSEGKSLKEAKITSYNYAEKINFQDKYFRSDIGDKGIKRYSMG